MSKLNLLKPDKNSWQKQILLSQGFTLVEVLVASSIMAVMIIAFMGLMEYQQKQYLKASLDNEIVSLWRDVISAVNNKEICFQNFGRIPLENWSTTYNYISVSRITNPADPDSFRALIFGEPIVAGKLGLRSATFEYPDGGSSIEISDDLGYRRAELFLTFDRDLSAPGGGLTSTRSIPIRVRECFQTENLIPSTTGFGTDIDEAHANCEASCADLLVQVGEVPAVSDVLNCTCIKEDFIQPPPGSIWYMRIYYNCGVEGAPVVSCEN